MRQLSELEGICLGIIARHKSCTAYRVRQELKDSPSSHWQASAGSVYPLLTRLETRQLIVAKAARTDRRGTRQLQITRKGAAALREWIRTGADADPVSSISDPVRSRMFFLQSLGRAARVRYLDAVIERMQDYLAETKTHLARKRAASDRYDYFGSLGATMVTEARLKWLKRVRAELNIST